MKSLLSLVVLILLVAPVCADEPPIPTQAATDFLATARDTILAVPGPFWVAATLLLYAIAKLIHRWADSARHPDNKTSLYGEIIAALKTPDQWTCADNTKLNIQSGRVHISLPTSYGQLDKSGIATVSIQTAADRSKQSVNMVLASWRDSRLKKITKKAIKVHQHLVEKECQAIAGQCLSSVRPTKFAGPEHPMVA